MASSQVEVKGSDVQLKHLGFVRILTINAVVLVSNLYDYAKRNSGSLKSTVTKVENAVTSVVSPAYEKFKSIPTDLLVFLDNKVDEVTYKFDESAPPSVKRVVSKAKLVLKKASQVAQDLAEEAKVAGPIAVVSHVSTVSKHFAVSQLAIVWYKINKHPTLHGVSEMAITTAAHWSEKYNKLVKYMTSKGYSLFSYVPLVPVDEIVKAYKQVEAAVDKKTDDASSSSSGSESDNE
ncbi:hypothetical protein ACJIZ3_004597 [Penstemon smallii]|uniref:REF/SRPP-like protein n=1 Tax=Penstemon smallii TaxID=265156 RepID=A0ABD3S2R0_9LAMI